MKFDAWARYLIVGADSSGNLKLSSDFDTQVFDHHEIECSSCGEKFREEEIVNHLSRAAGQPVSWAKSWVQSRKSWSWSCATLAHSGPF
jgi:hypothetical protein